MTDEIVEKRGPGRPRKNVVREKIVIEGVVSAPEHPDNVLELVYSSPLLFKKIFQIYKQYSVENVEFCFQRDYVLIKSLDHGGINSIHTEIFGRNLNRYFCKFPISILITLSDLESVMGQINKDQYKITFKLGEDYRSTLHIDIRNSECSSSRQYMVSIKSRTETPAELAPDANDYSVKFKLTGKAFKSIVNAAKKSDTLTFQKCWNSPLQIQTDQSHPSHFSEIFDNEEKINMISNLRENEIVSATTRLAYLKSFSNANITDEKIEFGIANGKRISIKAHIMREKQDKKDDEPIDSSQIVCSINILAALHSP